MMYLFFVACSVLAILAPASSTPSATTSSPQIQAPAGNIIGSTRGEVEYFRGIPYAEPPTRLLRLKKPSRLRPQETIQATDVGPACPQMTNFAFTPLLEQVTSDPAVAGPLFLGSAFDNGQEDCLTLSVMRPKDTPVDAKLPVLFWMHGGGFGIGSSQAYNGSVLVPRGVERERPFILVSVNYRLGGFGFLGGVEVLADGASNLGLLDQRMGLEWVSDNIESFGGDPNAVTIAGESAGSISVFDQMALYDGNNKYQGRPLFRSAIMHSGSIQNTQPVNGEFAQHIFDTVAAAANCSTESDKLECLRDADYDTFLEATMSVPAFLSNSSIALSYAPRQDGKILTSSSDILAKQRKFVKVPMIVGDMKNEGTIFSVYPIGITNRADLVSYLSSFIFKNASPKYLNKLLNLYPNGAADPKDGTFPGFLQLAGMLGDVFFTMKRRELLGYIPDCVPTWSFLGNWNQDTPVVGSFHTSDLPHLFYNTDPESRALQDRYLSFIDVTDPNADKELFPIHFGTVWPKWREGYKSLEFGSERTKLVKDNFRSTGFESIKEHRKDLEL